MPSAKEYGGILTTTLRRTEAYGRDSHMDLQHSQEKSNT